MALPQVLLKDVLSPTVRASQVFRREYGRDVDLERIRDALVWSQQGLMADLADLTTEARDLDLTVTSALQRRFGEIQSLEWDVQPADVTTPKEKALAQKWADLYRGALLRVKELSQLQYDLAWAAWDGRAAAEFTWERVAGVSGVSYAALAARPFLARELSFGPKRGLMWVDPWNAQGYFRKEGVIFEEYPGKFIAYTPRRFNEAPEREGIAPRAAHWTFFKRFSWRMRMALLEMWGIPWRIIQQTDTASMVDYTGQLKNAKNEVAALGAETTAALGPGMKLDVIQGASGEMPLITSTPEEINAELLRLILGTEATTQGTPGGLAGSTVATMAAQQALLVTLDAIGLAERWREQHTRPFMVANAGEEVATLYTPKVALITQKARDRARELEVVKTLVELRVPVAMKTVREIAGIAAPEEDDETIGAAPPAPEPGEAKEPGEAEKKEGETGKEQPMRAGPGEEPAEPQEEPEELEHRAHRRAVARFLDSPRNTIGRWSTGADGLPIKRAPLAPHDSRTGAPAVGPVPSLVPRLPAAGMSERQARAEEAFARAYEDEPEDFADAVLSVARARNAEGGAFVIETDDVKRFFPEWADDPAGRGELNIPLHPTATMAARRAVTMRLDELAALPEDHPQRWALVLAGGTGSGKGYLARSPIAREAGLVFDTAGEQNASDLGWTAKECQARGLPCHVAYLDADPADAYERTIARGAATGRVTDPLTHAESHTLGRENFRKFAAKPRANTSVSIIDTRGTPTLAMELPESEAFADVLERTRAQLDTAEREGRIGKTAANGARTGAKLWG